MRQILIIESQSDISKVIKLNILRSFDVNAIVKESIKDAIDLLEILPSVHLIIIRDASQETCEVADIVHYLNHKKLAIPLMVIGTKTSGYEHECLLLPKNTYQNFVEEIGKILGLQKNALDAKSKHDFVPVPANYFLNINETSIGCDVYIRLKKSANEFSYVKRLSSTDFFTRDEIEKYIQSGLTDFYIYRDQYETFVNFVTDKLTLKLVSGDFSDLDRIQFLSEAYDVTLDRINKLNIDERTISLVEESLKSMQVSLNDSRVLTHFLKKMQEDKLSYAYSHSYFTSLLMHKVIKSFD